MWNFFCLVAISIVGVWRSSSSRAPLWWFDMKYGYIFSESSIKAFSREHIQKIKSTWMESWLHGQVVISGHRTSQMLRRTVDESMIWTVSVMLMIQMCLKSCLRFYTFAWLGLPDSISYACRQFWCVHYVVKHGPGWRRHFRVSMGNSPCHSKYRIEKSLRR